MPSVAGTTTPLAGTLATGYGVNESLPAGYGATTPTTFSSDLLSRQALVALAGQAMLGPGDQRVEIVVESGPPFESTSESLLTPSDGSQAGFSVSISENVAVVGARGAGSADVFERDALGVWNEVAKLTADDGSPGGEFGTSVGIGGNLAIVGAA